MPTKSREKNKDDSNREQKIIDFFKKNNSTHSTAEATRSISSTATSSEIPASETIIETTLYANEDFTTPKWLRLPSNY
jgi:hypothetical protein